MPSNYTIPAGKPNAGKVVAVPADTDSADVPKAFKDFADSLPATPNEVPDPTAADAGKALTVNAAGDASEWADGTIKIGGPVAAPATGDPPASKVLEQFKALLAEAGATPAIEQSILRLVQIASGRNGLAPLATIGRGGAAVGLMWLPGITFYLICTP